MPARTRGRGGRSNRADEENIDAIQKARDLTIESGQATLQRAWDDLCQHFQRDRNAGLIHEDFPYWILHNVSDTRIELLIRTVYASSYAKIDAYTTLQENFGVPAWQFHLFLGPLPQNQLKRLWHATMDRRGITFDNLYQELCRIRSQKETLPDGPIYFKPKDFEAIFSDRDPEDDYEDNPEDDTQEDDTQEDDTQEDDTQEDDTQEDDTQEDDPQEEDARYGTGDSDNDYGHDTEQSIANSFDDASYIPANGDSPRDSRSPGIDALEGYATSPIHASSSTSVASPPPGVTATRRSATEDTAMLIAGQLGYDRQRQTFDSEMPGASRLSRELTVGFRISGGTEASVPRQSNDTYETRDQRIVKFFSAVESIRKEAEHLQKTNEKLNKDQLTIEKRESKASADIDDEWQTVRELARSDFTEGHCEVGIAKLSRLAKLCEKRGVVQSDREEYQMKRLRWNADMDNFQRRYVEPREPGSNATN